jgi:SAM-dependent methyltransferase
MSNVDAQEVEKFNQLASRWWDKNSEFKPLHDINPLRLEFSEQHAGDLAGKRILDIGCGGGILSEALAQAGAIVTGIDLATASLEVAKLHLRYMVGGRSNVLNEKLYRFEFPEYPGALLRFLNNMGKSWNISLFHYRNHGAAYGRILVGFQVPDSDQEKFKQFLQQLGYHYQEESDNPVYALFL